MDQYRLRISFLAAATTAVLSACGGSGSSGGGTDRELVELNSANVSLQPLKTTQSASFGTHLKNGLYTTSINQSCNDCAAMSSGDEAVMDASAPAPDFTQTNNQEAGVDEADRIKYNGEYLYIAANPYNDPIAPEGIADQDYIKVMQRHSDSTMSDVAQVDLPESFHSIRGLYLSDDALAAVGAANYWFDTMITDIWHPIDEKIKIAVYDVAEPSAIDLQVEVEFDGFLVSSRRIDNSLYLVSTYSPTVNGLTYGASTDEDKQRNYDTIMATSVDSLMPKLTINNTTTTNLVEPDNCFIPQDASNTDGYDSIVTITRVDLTEPSQIESVCINALTHDIYVSTESMYLMGVNSNDESVIHRFALNDAMAYVGTGNVDGHFGWRNASFRLSEHEQHLRVVTTKRDENLEPMHQLFILDTQAQDKILPVVAQLPNEQQPQEIGKPGEDIFAVRYFNDVGYIVTFERIDPLYVLDLSDPTAPVITGELEIPGFSTYLHPINDNLLLGVGQEVVMDVLPTTGGQAATSLPPAPEGVKIALFDVSDKTDPQLVNTLVYQDGFTAVEWDHHALSYLPVGDNQARVTLPITSWSETEDNQWLPLSSLKLLEVNFDANGAELIEKSQVDAPQPTEQYYYIDSHQDRAVMHGNDVYYIHGNDVISGVWQ